VPDPVAGDRDGGDPEHEAVVAEGVGLAMLVVLDGLGPAERVALVRHDGFAVPSGDRGRPGAVGGGGQDAGQPARRRVRGAAEPAADPERSAP
jgi:hypothetical protein